MKKGQTICDGKPYEYVYPDDLERDLKIQIPEIFEKEMYKLGRRKKDAIYVDIGANIGNASRYFYPYAKKIYSIEPSNEPYQALVENTKNLPNIETFNMAIGHIDGYDYLYSSETSSIPQTFFGGSGAIDAQKAMVKTMSTLFKENNISHVDVMKIDVEGAEYLILPSLGFAEVADKIDFIIGESHYAENGGFPQIIPLILNDYGFKTTFLDDRPNYTRTFTYNNNATNVSKSWMYPECTMFIAER
jgi:FkbM family methyltransferase